MTIAEQQQHEAELATTALPRAIELLRSGCDAIQLGKSIEAEFSLDGKKAYRWAVEWEAAFERDRRAGATRWLVPAWGGAVAAAWGLASLLFPIPPDGVLGSGIIAAAGVLLGGLGFFMASTVRRRATIQ